MRILETGTGILRISSRDRRNLTKPKKDRSRKELPNPDYAYSSKIILRTSRLLQKIRQAFQQDIKTTNRTHKERF